MRQGLLWLFCFAVGLPGAPSCNASSVERDRALSHALYALGVQYRWGGASPESGFDCSGLVTYVFERAWGLALPRSTEEQRRVGTPVRLKELEPGDLIFYNTRNRPFSHVGIYVGRGFFVHAPRPGAAVRMESVQTPYWRSRFNGARRLDPPTF